MKQNYEKKFELAKLKFDLSLYNEALEILLNDPDSLPQDKVFLAVACYKLINPQRAEELLKNKKNVTEDLYFAIVRDYQDYKEETNEKFIDDEIHRFIHPDTPLLRENSHNESPLEAKTLQLGKYAAATVTSQGPRENMEDTHVLKVLDLSIKEQKFSIPFFAVMDGHGGAGCAKYVRDHLYEVLHHEFEKIQDFSNLEIYNALCRTFTHINDNWKTFNKNKKRHKDWSGTTLLLAVIIDSKSLWIANAGDSRAVLGQQLKIYQLSDDAKATKEFYQNQILSRGGSVVWNRVDGNLSMTHAIGDLRHPSISARPQIRHVDLMQLQPEDQNILILATDGLWDVIGSEQAVELADGNSISDIAENLQTTAYALGSFDNITIVIIDLNG